MKNAPLVVSLSLYLILPITYAQQALANQATQSEDATRVQVTWLKPEKYTDTRSSNMSAKKHREQIFKQLEAHLTELSAQLPTGQSLKLTVTNLDLAGRVEPGRFSGLVDTMNDIRIVRDIDIPRMSFDYQLINAEGQVLKTEKVNLKDMNFLQSPRIREKDRPFAYEKRMLTEWFEDSFTQNNA